MVGSETSTKNRIYVAIDLKSFYASVEARERGLDPMTTNLVVADESRTAKTICLAVSPSLKKYGIPGRARLFEVIQKVKTANKDRLRQSQLPDFRGESYSDIDLQKNPELAISYIVAPPRMALYLDYSTRIYSVYLKYIAPEDIHVYSVDEVMMDVTDYLHTYKMTPAELTSTIIQDVLKTTGITAAAGIGTNMYLCKIAMDIMAKHAKPDQNGVRIAELDEYSYRKLLWTHTPIRDFWRVGTGYAKKLEEIGLFTMGDIARCSIGKKSDYYNEDLLYKLFGVNAETLIDHAWGWEPCTIADVKAYKPASKCISSGQVLQCPYDAEKAKLVVKEMADLLALNLVEKRMVTDQIVLTIGYDTENLKNNNEKAGGNKNMEITIDRYGRKVPKHGHGTQNLDSFTSSGRVIVEAIMSLYDRITDSSLLVRRITIGANHLILEEDIPKEQSYEQMELFTDYTDKEKLEKEKETLLSKERKMQIAILEIKKKYGKNAVLKGMNLQEGATARERNAQIGGHRAGES
ncbi:MAG: DNA methylase [Blautia sp.]|nr:DNA methylase [Blautia sp.]